MQELKLDKPEIEKTMEKVNADVLGAAIAYANPKGKITTEVIGFTDKKLTKPVNPKPVKPDEEPESVFGAASLSKVVFAYLVLKLIEKNKANRETLVLGKFDLESNGIAQFNLDTPLYQILPMEEFSEEFKNASEADKEKAKTLTARMVLSHQTGIRDEKGPAIQFEFKPNSGKFSYSGIAIAYLQKVIEKLTDSNLEELSQEHIFGSNALDMKNSSFVEDKNNPPVIPRKANSANSLFTTASDYAKFSADWMNDPSEEMQAAFEPAVTMESDDWAIRQNVPKEDRENLGWGLGWGLQLENGCDIYLMTNFKNGLEEYKPEDLEKFKNKYVLFGNNLRYINADKTVSKITLTDPDKLLEYITDFNKYKEKENSEKIHLSNQQFKNYITDNGGHKLKRKAVRAYHSGDMNKWRAWVALNLEKKTAIVYFANSEHGHMLADQIISPNIELDHALNAFFIKWGFMRKIPENFEGCDIHVMPAFPECNLYLMSSFPENLEQYKNNYILYNYQIRYINSDGTFKVIKIDNIDKFLKTLVRLIKKNLT